MPLRIRVSNLNKKRRPHLKAVKRAAAFVLRKNKITDALIDITFVNNAKIKNLNQKYMGKKAVTDVLSFLLEDKSMPKAGMLGDIYISSDMAFANARRFNTSFHSELVLYVIHGLLHLLGLGDRTAKEKKKIREAEKAYLRKIL